MTYRPTDEAGAPAAPGEVTWSMSDDPRRTPLYDSPNQVLERDVWTDGRRRRIMQDGKWKLSEAQTVGVRYAYHFDLVVPGSGPFDQTVELPADLVAEHRSAYLRYVRTQQQLGDFWRTRGDAGLLGPRPLKGGVTFMAESEPEDAMIGDRWIKGKSRHDPALVLTERGWVEA